MRVYALKYTAHSHKFYFYWPVYMSQEDHVLHNHTHTSTHAQLCVLLSAVCMRIFIIIIKCREAFLHTRIVNRIVDVDLRAAIK